MVTQERDPGGLGWGGGSETGTETCEKGDRQPSVTDRQLAEQRKTRNQRCTLGLWFVLFSR